MAAQPPLLVGVQKESGHLPACVLCPPMAAHPQCFHGNWLRRQNFAWHPGCPTTTPSFVPPWEEGAQLAGPRGSVQSPLSFCTKGGSSWG